MSTPRPRTYVVGLPVVVTVGPDGHLLISVDASEMSSAIWEDGFGDEDDYTEDEVAEDTAAIDAALYPADPDAPRRYHVQIGGAS